MTGPYPKEPLGSPRDVFFDSFFFDPRTKFILLCSNPPPPPPTISGNIKGLVSQTPHFLHKMGIVPNFLVSSLIVKGVHRE